jgi:hypothetical protein
MQPLTRHSQRTRPHSYPSTGQCKWPVDGQPATRQRRQLAADAGHQDRPWAWRIQPVPRVHSQRSQTSARRRRHASTDNQNQKSTLTAHRIGRSRLHAPPQLSNTTRQARQGPADGAATSEPNPNRAVHHCAGRHSVFPGRSPPDVAPIARTRQPGSAHQATSPSDRGAPVTVGARGPGCAIDRVALTAVASGRVAPRDSQKDASADCAKWHSGCSSRKCTTTSAKSCTLSTWASPRSLDTSPLR